MKNIKYLITIFLLLSIDAMAFGKLTLRQPIITEQNNRNVEVGLYINESLTESNFYQSWTGGQVDQYFTTNHEILHKVTPKLDIGLGASYRGMTNSDYDFFTGIVIEYKLWK